MGVGNNTKYERSNGSARAKGNLFPLATMPPSRPDRDQRAEKSFPERGGSDGFHAAVGKMSSSAHRVSMKFHDRSIV
jgi:hypothetical protein